MTVAEIAQLLRCKINIIKKMLSAQSAEAAQDKGRLTLSFSVQGVQIRLYYVLTETMLCPRSTLFAQVQVGEREHSMPELCEDIAPEDLRCWYFPYIEDEARLDACIEELCMRLSKYMPRLVSFCADEGKIKALLERERMQVKRIFKLSEDAQPSDKYLDYLLDLQMRRFTSESCYKDFLHGRYEAAIKGYRKLVKSGKALDYEKRILTHMESVEAGYVYEVIPKECLGKENNGAGAGFLSFALCYLIFSLLFSGLILLHNAAAAQSWLYYSGTPWLMGLVFAPLAALSATAVISGIRKRKKARESKAPSSAKGALGLAWVVFAVVIALTLGLMRFVLSEVVRIDKTSLTFTAYYPPDIFRAQTESLRLSDIDAVYLIDGSYNESDEYVEHPSYVIVTKDGLRLDLDRYADTEETEERILPLLGIQAKDVIKLASEREIPVKDK